MRGPSRVECAQRLSRCVASPHCKPIPLYCPTQRSVLARFLHRPSRNREAHQPRRTVLGCVRAREGGAAPTPRRDCLCRTLSLGCLSSSGCNTPICVLFFLARFVIICGCWAAARRPSSARIVCDPQQALGGAAAPYYRCGGTGSHGLGLRPTNVGLLPVEVSTKPSRLTGQQRGAESLLNNRIHTFHSSLTLWLQNNYQPQLSSLSGDKMGAIDSLLRKADEDGVRVFGVTPTTLPGRGIGMVATRDLEVR